MHVEHVGRRQLINPAMFLLDELISGLDSITAMHLISLLQVCLDLP
jgi:ABC-type multidrug transport system ATPase subunit